jgi:hypothetical protein
MTRFEQLNNKIYDIEIAAKRCRSESMRQVWLQKQYQLEQQILDLTIDRACLRVK